MLAGGGRSLHFTWDILKEAAAALENLDDLAARLLRAMHGQGVSASARTASWA
jgi:hypothetical protein